VQGFETASESPYLQPWVDLEIFWQLFEKREYSSHQSGSKFLAEQWSKEYKDENRMELIELFCGAGVKMLELPRRSNP